MAATTSAVNQSLHFCAVGVVSGFPRLCSLIPGLGVKLSTIILAGPTVLSAVGACPPHDGVRRRWRINVASAVALSDARKKSDDLTAARQGRLFPAVSREPCDLLCKSPQDQSRPRPLARSILSGSPRRSMSVSTTRPVQHNIPLPLSIVARPHEAGLIRSWRANSLCLCLARSRNYPMLQNSAAFCRWAEFEFWSACGVLH